jgi:hypothetical protein
LLLFQAKEQTKKAIGSLLSSGELRSNSQHKNAIIKFAIVIQI